MRKQPTDNRLVAVLYELIDSGEVAPRVLAGIINRIDRRQEEGDSAHEMVPGMGDHARHLATRILGEEVEGSGFLTDIVDKLSGGKVVRSVNGKQLQDGEGTSPAWAVKAAKGAAATPGQIREHVIDILEAMKGRRPAVGRCATDAKHVLKVWRGVYDRGPLEELTADARLIARWAQNSADSLAQNDIRGIRPNGEQWGTNRSRHPSTLCALDRWSDRLDAARQWAATHPEKPEPPEDPGPGPSPLLPGLGRRDG